MLKGQECRLRLYLVRHGESEANQQGVFAGQLDSPLTECGVIDAKSIGETSEFIIVQPPAQSQVLPLEHDPRERHSCHFDAVYSSDLIRAHDTCKLILEGLRTRKQNNLDKIVGKDHDGTASDIASPSHDIQLDQRLRERSYGTLQGMPWSSDRNDTDKIWTDSHEKDELPPIFESDDDIWIRVKDFLLEMVEDELLLTRNIETWKQMNCNDAGKAPTVNNAIPTKHILITSHGGVLRQILMRLVGVDQLKKRGAVFDTKRKNRLITPNTSLTILDLSVRCKQQHANSRGENEEESTSASYDSNLREDGDNDDDLKDIQVDMIVFANTDHLKAEVRIHDD
jgi:broad specificity phosphatase PhoE